jgi:hypothetical protein
VNPTRGKIKPIRPFNNFGLGFDKKSKVAPVKLAENAVSAPFTGGNIL